MLGRIFYRYRKQLLLAMIKISNLYNILSGIYDTHKLCDRITRIANKKEEKKEREREEKVQEIVKVKSFSLKIVCVTIHTFFPPSFCQVSVCGLLVPKPHLGLSRHLVRAVSPSL